MKYMKIFEHIFGFILISLGIVIVITAELGAGPMDAFNYYLSGIISKSNAFFTVGRIAILNGLFAVLLSYVLSKDKKVFISFIFIFIVGNFIDIWIYLFGFFPDDWFISFVSRLILASIGVIILGIGVALTVNSGLPPSPFESLLLVLDKKINNISITKALIDGSYLIVALILGFIYGDILEQIGIFTVVLTLFTGVIVKYFSNHIIRIKSKKGDKSHVIK